MNTMKEEVFAMASDSSMPATSVHTALLATSKGECTMEGGVVDKPLHSLNSVTYSRRWSDCLPSDRESLRNLVSTAKSTPWVSQDSSSPSPAAYSRRWSDATFGANREALRSLVASATVETLPCASQNSSQPLAIPLSTKRPKADRPPVLLTRRMAGLSRNTSSRSESSVSSISSCDSWSSASSYGRSPPSPLRSLVPDRWCTKSLSRWREVFEVSPTASLPQVPKRDGGSRWANIKERRSEMPRRPSRDFDAEDPTLILQPL